MRYYLIAGILTLGFLAKANTPSTHPLIKSILVGNQALEFSSDSILVLESPRELVFLFNEFGQDTTIKYQMANFNPDWKWATAPVAVYSILGKGEYTFKTWMVANEEEFKMPDLVINVGGPLIGNWWFVPLLVFYLLLLLGGAMYFIFLSNFRSKQKLSELRMDWTNKLHNDIGGDLSSISLRLNTLKRRLKDVDPRFQEGLAKTYGILENIQKRLRFVFDLVDPKKDSLKIMLADVEDFARENFQLKGIDFQYYNQLQPELDFSIDIGRVNKLYLTMKEAVNNSVKYSEASLAKMEISQVKEGLKIKIEDDGVGFDPNGSHNGNGVANLKQYSKEGFIDIDIDSAPGKGTSVTMLVPDL